MLLPVGGAVSPAGVVTCIASIGKRRAQSLPKTLVTAAATVVSTITSPVYAVVKAPKRHGPVAQVTHHDRACRLVG